MKHSVFITGITGFLGKTLLKKLDSSLFNNVFFLIRDKNSDILDNYPDNFIAVFGSLDNPESYKDILKEVDVILHMASVTGKVSKVEYHNTIVKATKKLLELSKENNIINFIYISSIAAKFSKKNRYYYGLAKKEAEQAVANSGLNYLIIRPTMILGKGSAVFEGFENLASLPITPIFGNGKTIIQPIAVEDIANRISAALIDKNYNNEIVEYGGNDKISIDEFIKRINHIKNNNKKTKLIHIPISPVIFFLSIFETFAYRFLPITVGQLASFRNDSTSTNPPNLSTDINELTLDEMIEMSLQSKPQANADTKLIKECKTFCKYLSGMRANGYVIDKYVKYHRISDIENKKKQNPFEKFLLKIATIHPLFTKPIDIYTKFLLPQSLLRFKLSYLLAILEVSSPYYKKIDLTEGIGKIKFLFLLGIKGGIFGLQLVLSIIFLFPFDVIFRLISPKKKGEKNA